MTPLVTGRIEGMDLKKGREEGKAMGKGRGVEGKVREEGKGGKEEETGSAKRRKGRKGKK